MVIEMAGLPGSGKTTIARALAHPMGGKGAVPLFDLRLSMAWLRAMWQLLWLAASARPFRFNRLKRAINTALLLRHYQPHGRDILLDQGTVQKLWSILASARSFPQIRLDNALAALVAFAPDHLVWVDTPLDQAIARMGGRTGGKSRYDRLPPDIAHEKLVKRAALLKDIAQRYAAASGRHLITLDGQDPAALNARKLEELTGP
jgi:thymidylate kinase